MTFLDIFSTKKLKPNKENKIKIIIDHREKNSLVASYLAHQGFQIEFQQLPVADYLIGNTAIERKTISDFKSSIINKRIISQLQEIKQYPKHILILEGITEETLYENIINENAFRGFLLSIILEFQVPIIYTQSEEDTARYIAILAKKEKNPKESSLRASKLLKTEEQQLQYILEGFPHIGPTTAKKLLTHFKTLKAIINAPDDELQDLIGKKAESLILLRSHLFSDSHDPTKS